MPDLRDLLERGAGPERPAPTEGIVRRGRRRRARLRVGVGVAGVALVVVAALAAGILGPQDPMPVVGDAPTMSPSTLEPTSSATAAVTDGPRTFDLGAPLRVDDLGDLPAEGVAIEVVGGSVVFVDMDGRVMGHLGGASLATPGPPVGGRPTRGPLLLLVDREPISDESSPRSPGDEASPGDVIGYVEAGAGDVEVLGTRQRWRMAHGHVLERVGTGDPAGFSLVGPDGDDTGWHLATGGGWIVGADRALVGQRADATAPVETYDLAGGGTVPLPAGCLPSQRITDGILLVCQRDTGDMAQRDWATVELWRGDYPAPTLLLEPRVWPGQDRPLGHYRHASLSPDGRWVGAHWSGECESPTAVVAEVGASTKPRPMITAGDGQALESSFHGWTTDGRALVTTTEGLCSAGDQLPGLYLVDPASGDRELLWQVPDGAWTAIQPWGPLEP